MTGLLVGVADDRVMWCLRPALERARTWADEAGLDRVGIVVGAPSAAQWPDVAAMDRVVQVLGGGVRGSLYEAPISAMADVICGPTAADLMSVDGFAGSRVVIGLPRPEGPAPKPAAPGARVKAVIRACRRAVPRIDHRTVAIASGRGAGVAAEAIAGWMDGRPVVALTDSPAPPVLVSGGALVAANVLLGFEAVEVLAGSSALRRSLARRGRDAIDRMPAHDEVAQAVLEAVALAAAPSERLGLSP